MDIKDQQQDCRYHDECNWCVIWVIWFVFQVFIRGSRNNYEVNIERLSHPTLPIDAKLNLFSTKLSSSYDNRKTWILEDLKILPM